MERNITLSSEMRRNPVRNTESYDDLLEAKQWALDTQKGRRNLDKWALGKIALKLRPEIEAKAKANQDTRTDLLTILSKGQSLVNTRKELADGVGIDERTMGKVMQIDEHAPAAGKEALDKGKLSVNRREKSPRGQTGGGGVHRGGDGKGEKGNPEKGYGDRSSQQDRRGILQGV